MSKKITQENAIKLIESTNGSIFAVEFKKKDGTVRAMNCRLGVSKGVKGTGLSFDASSYDLLPVYDLQAKGYRMIVLNTLRRVTVQGQSYSVVA